MYNICTFLIIVVPRFTLPIIIICVQGVNVMIGQGITLILVQVYDFIIDNVHSGNVMKAY